MLVSTSCRTNSRVAGDLRQYDAHVTSMWCKGMTVLGCRSGPPSHKWYFDRIWILIKIRSAPVWSMLNRSQLNSACVTTVALLWCVQNFIVISRVHLKPEHFKFWSNFEFDRNIVSGTGARGGGPGVGVTKTISSKPLFSSLFIIVNIHVSHWISHVIKRIQYVLLQNWKSCLWRN